MDNDFPEAVDAWVFDTFAEPIVRGVWKCAHRDCFFTAKANIVIAFFLIPLVMFAANYALIALWQGIAVTFLWGCLGFRKMSRIRNMQKAAYAASHLTGVRNPARRDYATRLIIFVVLGGFAAVIAAFMIVAAVTRGPVIPLEAFVFVLLLLSVALAEYFPACNLSIKRLV